MNYPQIDTLLFFGSFDPLTIGHMALIDTALSELTPRTLELIPAANQGWGKQLSSFADRVAMIELVIAARPHWQGIVKVNAIEQTAKLSGITADTLHYLLKSEKESQKLGLLMGSDWIFSLPTWEEWEWMLQVAPAFVALRGEETIESVSDKVDANLRPLLNRSVFLLPEALTLPTKTVSSTRVRSEYGKTQQTDLVIPEVRSYMEKQQLYQT